jgi:choline dehydrogenase-like flavoprotein
MDTQLTDVLVIGTGFGAAAPALRFAQAGFRVTMIEKGPRIDPFADFRQTQDPRYILQYLHSLTGDHLGLTYAEAMGGGSGFYEMVSLRAPSRIFEQTDRTGERLWPDGLDRRALDPWYDIADRMLNVEQIDPALVPKSGLVFAQLMKSLGYSCERARYAVKGCMGSGFCVTGCIYGAKQSLLVTYLPQAVEAGATIHTDLEAVVIRPLGRGAPARHDGPLSQVPHRYEVVCRNRHTGRERAWRARIVILGGGTIGTAQLLLASRPHLERLSDQVGQHIGFNGSVKAAGMLPDSFPAGDMFRGRSHPGMISYQFLESHGITIAAAKPLPLQLVTAARLRLEGDCREAAWWGAPNQALMASMRERMMVLLSLGTTPPTGRLTIDAHGKPTVHLPLTRDLRRYHEDIEELLHDIMRRNGMRVIAAEARNGLGEPRRDVFFSTAHHTGSARMARAKSLGVVDADGEVFDYPGLYVSDGAAIPSSLAVNTSLTILANAERIAAGILSRVSARPRLRVASRSRRS